MSRTRLQTTRGQTGLRGDLARLKLTELPQFPVELVDLLPQLPVELVEPVLVELLPQIPLELLEPLLVELLHQIPLELLEPVMPHPLELVKPVLPHPIVASGALELEIYSNPLPQIS